MPRTSSTSAAAAPGAAASPTTLCVARLTQKAAHVELRTGAALRAAGDLPLSAHEDAPMCVAVHPHDATLVCGVNEAADQLAHHNHHLRTYTFDTARPSARADGAAEVALAPARAVPSLGIADAEHYQRTAAFSPDGALLAVASSDGRVQLHRYPSLAPVWTQPYAVPGGDEVYDTDFSHDGTQLVVATGAQLLVLSTAPQTTEADGTTAPRVLQTIARVSFGTLRGTFRAARFGRGTGDAGTRSRLFALVNTPAQDAKTRASYVVAWDADTWKLQRARRVAKRPGTVLSVRYVAHRPLTQPQRPAAGRRHVRPVCVGAAGAHAASAAARRARPRLPTDVPDVFAELACGRERKRRRDGAHAGAPRGARAETVYVEDSCSDFRRAALCRVFGAGGAYGGMDCALVRPTHS